MPAVVLRVEAQAPAFAVTTFRPGRRVHSCDQTGSAPPRQRERSGQTAGDSSVKMLEDVLRESLVRQAGSVVTPAPAELADRVVRRARRLRRQQALGLAVVMVVVAGMAGVALSFPPDPNHADSATDAGVAAPGGAESGPEVAVPPLGGYRPDADAPASRARNAMRLPVDVVAANRLVTTDGDSIDLSFAGAVSQAYRVSGGWLVVGTQATARSSSLWYVTGTAKPRTVLSGVEDIALAPDGQKLAWRAGRLMYFGAVLGGTLATKQGTVAPDLASPVGFVGDGVLLSRGKGSSWLGGYDVWWPARGEYTPTWHPSAVAVYGALNDGRTVVGQVSVRTDSVDGSGATTRRPCLALLDATAALKLLKTACDLGMAVRSTGAVSPDGRWLVADTSDQAVLVDLTTTFAGKPRFVGAGPALEAGAAWLDQRTLVHPGAGRTLVQLRLDQLETRQIGGVQQMSVPDLPTEAQVLVVPRLG
jgi:hypothetical protein